MVFTTLSNNSKKHLKIVKPDRAKKKDMGANELIFSGQNIKQLPSKKENNHLNEIYEAVVEGS
ncbi:MAG: hypothetical protein IIA45_09175, partial [Bacteroidetes bacterium]|nr:hypothetical protein [Bacteroidota bacterium]